MKTNKKLTPVLRITLTYLIFAGLWIIFSDRILGILIPDAEQYRQFQTYKGWFFVFVTAILLFNIIYREFRRQWKYEKELETVADISYEILGITDLDLLTENILTSLKNIFLANRVFIAINDPNKPNIQVSMLENSDNELSMLYLDKTEPFVSNLLNSGQMISSFPTPSPSQPHPLRLSKSLSAFVLNPLIVSGSITGFVGFAREQLLQSSDIHIIKAISIVIAQQLQSSELIQKNQTQIERLSLLRKIDETILTNLETNNLLDQLIKIITNNSQSFVMSISFLDPITNQIHISRSKILEDQQTILFNRHHEYINSIKKPLFIHDYFKEVNLICNMPTDHPLRSGKFHGYAVCPIVIKGLYNGLVEVFTTEDLNWDDEEKDFFSAFCNQIAIALDNTNTFNHLKKSNENLLMAYEQTLEGWSKALELRDRETEDHTKRAIQLTMQIANFLNLSEDQIVHIRRGVLLHDIGKLGVPDEILRKPGPLNDQEWEIMHKHPVDAYNLLRNIEYLRPALNIPYCHHEKWDGSGYPQGLRGEEIPIEARIFAIVDVFDALTSDRPYRNALSREETLEYIKSQSGKHFDPVIVGVFMKIFADQENHTSHSLTE